MKESTDMTLIGPVLKEQQKIIDSTIEKKLQLSKIQTTLLQKSSSSDTNITMLDDDIKDTISQLLDKGTDD